MGRLIAIEGIDGSGKGTQAQRLVQSIEARGQSVRLFSFPRYEQTAFGRRIGHFLNGRYGELNQVDPLLVSLLYAGDRFESKSALQDAIAACDIVVLDRYVPSNIAHQCAKRTGKDRDDLRQWIENLEYRIYGLPHPDLCLLLDLPVESAQELIAKKQKRTYTEKAADLQEADAEYLAAVRDVYLQLAETSENWRRVEVLRDGTVRPVDEIADEVLGVIGR
ncbi:MAG: dTMP kinase [Planctomycetota bacterium]|nr:MAG: dTMP kinase [Planctomycetota bacterium]REJ88345.1 MAG: dTMP kinase [Planctomycetota bacterium]REK30693.1 MAG: dTMP kinase [Planctomycetota bacterium]REK33068.1 MAG: dTMP kinase [Planctomycetota bacterium]